jgi:AAA+ superfamily predicted ATPase
MVLMAAIQAAKNRWNRPRTIDVLLTTHFDRSAQFDIEVHAREFPYRVCVDAYRSLTKWLAVNCQLDGVVGVPVTSSFLSSISISTLLAPSQGCIPTALEYDSLDVGEDKPVPCVKHALWLLQHPQGKMAVLWTSTMTHSGCGFTTKLRLELAFVKGQPVAQLSPDFFACIEQGIQAASTYRGKILSLEESTDYRGNSGGILVHRLRSVKREDVILPEATVRLLERNVVRFVAQRPELAKLGMPTKKGLLFYGPPGTGKTHTIHYLIGALPGHTTLLVTGEQVGMLEEYVTLARLLQPSMIVIEDADLIGRERDGTVSGRESLLNRLLNEMDGLRPDAEILFLLTTNQPESLEKALAARPGRVDQAIEFPLPDEVGRRKLIQLYSPGIRLRREVVEHTARKTEGVSASFIKELMRRSVQFHLECRTGNGDGEILQNDVDQAIDELLFIGGSLNRKLLGAECGDDGDD